MVLSARFTTVLSSITMNSAKHMQARVRRLRLRSVFAPAPSGFALTPSASGLAPSGPALFGLTSSRMVSSTFPVDSAPALMRSPTSHSSSR